MAWYINSFGDCLKLCDKDPSREAECGGDVFFLDSNLLVPLLYD